MNSAVYLMPLTAAITYTFATIFTKRAIEGGAGIVRACFITNIAMAFLSACLLLVFRPQMPEPEYLIYPALSGALFFVGQIMIFFSIRLGDVTIQVPMLGVKVIFVSLFLILFTGTEVSNRVIAASIITTCAVFLLGLSNVKFTKEAVLTIGFVIAANINYALSDCIIQSNMGDIGPVWFLFTMYIANMVLSFGLIPFFRAPLRAIPASAWKWLLSGAVCMCFQACLLVTSIGVFKIAAQANIIYSTRGLWSIIIIWFAGKSLGIHEKGIGTRLMLQRLGGAVMLLAAVIVAIA